MIAAVGGKPRSHLRFVTRLPSIDRVNGFPSIRTIQSKRSLHSHRRETILIYACAGIHRTFARRPVRSIGYGPEASRADQHAGVVGEIPSFQLALLKPTLERAGIPAQTFSLFMYFGTRIGWKVNEAIADVWPSMVGEWIWSKAAFGEDR